MNLFLLYNNELDFYSEQGIDYEVYMFLKEYKKYLKTYSVKKENQIFTIHAALYNINDAEEFIGFFVDFLRYKDFYSIYREKYDKGFCYQFVTAFNNEGILKGWCCKIYLI